MSDIHYIRVIAKNNSMKGDFLQPKDNQVFLEGPVHHVTGRGRSFML